MTDRLARTFARCRAEGRGALSVYLPSGFPDAERADGAFEAVVQGGADLVEIGIPFSDPAADGPVIEAATAAALHSGHRVHHAMALCRRLRADHPDLPLVAMTYANVLFHRGWQEAATELAAAGFDGVILPDVPLEESAPVRAALAAAGLAWIPLVTPTTPSDRMAAIAATATGFLYVVSSVGITGQADPGPLVEATVRRARDAGADVPLVVGFGIASAEDVRRVLDAGADGAIVGSHLVRLVADGADHAILQKAVQSLGTGTKA